MHFPKKLQNMIQPASAAEIGTRWSRSARKGRKVAKIAKIKSVLDLQNNIWNIKSKFSFYAGSLALSKSTYTEECFPCTFVTFPYQAWERLRHIGKNLLVGGYTCFVKKGPVSFFKIMMTTNRAFNEGLSWPSRQSLSNCEPTPFHGRQKTNGKHMKGMFFAHLSISLP